jgi:hypothetical protein
VLCPRPVDCVNGMEPLALGRDHLPRQQDRNPAARTGATRASATVGRASITALTSALRR